MPRAIRILLWALALLLVAAAMLLIVGTSPVFGISTVTGCASREPGSGGPLGCVTTTQVGSGFAYFAIGSVLIFAFCVWRLIRNVRASR